MFTPGTLWSKTLDRTEKALRTGTLRPIFTRSTFIHDCGIDFLVRIVSSLVRKSEEKKEHKKKTTPEKQHTNPFLPYEENLFVTDISDTHVCLLNKFNVIDHHLLIVTRSFEEQESLLTLQDFEAIWICMAEFDGLAFYNGGEIAGSSQRHKHLQMIPLPMADKGPKVPIEPLLTSARFEGNLCFIPGLPFVHVLTRPVPVLTAPPRDAATELLKLYRAMLYAVGLNSPSAPYGSRQSGPYNLLLTREWMLLVPRSDEFFESISVNALGFAGALLVQDELQMELVKDIGGMAVLERTAVTASK